MGTEASALDIPRIFTISESAHRIHNPFTPEKYATLGAALRLKPGTRVLDLGSGSGDRIGGLAAVKRDDEYFMRSPQKILGMKLSHCLFSLNTAKVERYRKDPLD